MDWNARAERWSRRHVVARLCATVLLAQLGDTGGVPSPDFHAFREGLTELGWKLVRHMRVQDL